MHQDPVTKGQRLVASNGALVSTIELDPFGGDTNRSVNASFQPRHFTTYERDTVGGMDEAMARRYHGWWSRFSQPDPYDGSYSLSDPQSFNRYGYVQSDPVNFVDPSGLDGECIDVDGNIVECGPDIIDDRVFTNIWDRYLWGPLWDLYWGRRDYIPLILPVLNDGSRPVVELIPIPERSPDGNTGAVNNALGACSATAAVGQYSTVNAAGTAWRGSNGKWNQIGWGGNQHTGARSVAISRASSLRLLGRNTGVLGAGFSGYQAIEAIHAGDNGRAGKATLDGTMALVGVLGGPKGAAVSAAYFVIDATAGWGNCINAMQAINPGPCDASCRRK